MLSYSHIIVQEFFSTLLYNVASVLWTLQHCFMHSSLKSHHSISGRLRSGLWLDHCNTLILFFFRHSAVDLLLCLGSLSCWWPSYSHALAVRQMASHLTLEYFGIQRSSWWTQWIHGVEVQYFSWYIVFGFLQTCCCALWPNISTLVWSVQRTLFQKSCALLRCSFANLSCAAMFFL